MFANQQLAGAHRTLLEKVAEQMKTLEKDQIVAFAPKLLELMASKTLASEVNEYKIRKELAGAYSFNLEYGLAARTLADIHLEQVKE